MIGRKVPNFGDRYGSLVYVKDNTLGVPKDAGYWLDVLTGQATKLSENKLVSAIKDLSFKDKEKPDVVSFYRYRRRMFFPDWCNGRIHLVDNMFGVTYLFEINYKTKVVSFSYAIAKNENFSRYIGRSLARHYFESGRVIRMPMPSIGISEYGVVADVTDYILQEVKEDTVIGKWLIAHHKPLLNAMDEYGYS